MAILRGDTADPADGARDARADLHGRSFAAEGAARADLEGAKEELANRIAELHRAAACGICHLHLRDTAASRARDHVLQEHAADEPAERRRQDGPEHPRLSGGPHRGADQVVLADRDGEVEADRGKSANDADDDGEDEEALRLGRREAQLSAECMETQKCDA
jgi:hypothetical protein